MLICIFQKYVAWLICIFLGDLAQITESLSDISEMLISLAPSMNDAIKYEGLRNRKCMLTDISQLGILIDKFIMDDMISHFLVIGKVSKLA